MNRPGIVISAPRSGSGKTLITIALMKALLLEGKKVAGYKCGPDFIDTMFHKKILGIPSKNLDLFFTGEEQTQQLFLQDNNSDISVVEGVMGLYDGLGGISESASTYHLAKVLQLPVILVIDSKGMSRSVLAEIAGFLSMDYARVIKGVILNNMTSAIYESIKSEIEETYKVKVLGYFPQQKNLKLESRYLGLKLPDEIADIQNMTEQAARELVKTVDLSEIISLAKTSGAQDAIQDLKGADSVSIPSAGRKVSVGIAMDEAFCFYYEDNLRLLREAGVELVPFSPVKDEALPEGISGIILGGGYPELFGEQLEKNVSMKNSIKAAIEKGIPSLAECGGFMYLHNSIKTKEGKIFKMCGVIDGRCEYKDKLVRFGYITVRQKSSPEICIKGHEFHYFDSDFNGSACVAEKPVTGRNWECCHLSQNHWWGFPHLYYPSNPAFVSDFTQKCFEFKEREEGESGGSKLKTE